MTMSSDFIRLSLVLLLAGCTPPPEAKAGDVLRYVLPSELVEVSGLAATGPSSVLAVADEQAVLFEIDVSTGTVVRRVPLGNPPIRGDFEGIALVGDTVHVVTSGGELYSASWPASNDKVARRDTGVRKRCEVEGLAAAANGELLLLCKTVKGELKNGLVVFAYDPQSSEPARDRITISSEELASRVGTDRFNPSGIELLAGGGYLVVAARQKMFVVLSEQGEVRYGGALPHPQIHRQTEGVTLLPDGRMVLADEGGKGDGVLSVYDSLF